MKRRDDDDERWPIKRGVEMAGRLMSHYLIYALTPAYTYAQQVEKYTYRYSLGGNHEGEAAKR